ncbi:Ger(x)C family spore germination protein [Halalkalibacter hemicellulosilyticus]|uniref:Spore germination protein n=1 Tax=Halalkalibacter hemicellulosilyticusJCM 9152 TaxID=1236971 RepID=W4QAI8_9BACI|nr:Ger(x)C family spore germination protein [Halalkalibacter hemicellulosilyticus]GAE28972.1 spore germination protein [Halalkalibacter hemicellulosilyticusJCM 9152]
MGKVLRLSYLVLFLLLLSACLETSIVDEVALIRIVSIDKADEEDYIKVTVNFPTFLEQGEESLLQQGSISATGQTTKGTKILLNRRSQKPLRFGQARVMLFGDELAKEGVEVYLDAMYRDPSVGNRMLIGIVKGNNAGEMLETELGVGELAGVFIPDLIQQNMDLNTIPSANMHEFLFSMYNDGRDPFAPMLKLQGNHVRIIGTALFSDQSYHSEIGLDESFILKTITSVTKQAIKQFEVKDEEGQSVYIVIEKLNSQLNKQVDKSGESPLFRFHIHIDGEMQDHSGDFNFDEPETVDNYEQKIEEKLKLQTLDMLERFRDQGIDPVGIGELYRSTTRDWNPTLWKEEIYSTANFEVNVSINIVQSGAIE